jgi:TatA/E family protein of Tat protein translocase
MESLLQPIHLILIFAIVIIIFGTGKLPKDGKGFGRGISGLRGGRNHLLGAVFMAQGVDPEIGRDVGDMLPNTGLSRTGILYLFLLAILIGNTLYFLLSPILPAAARMGTVFTFGLPALVDLWICSLILGLLSFLSLARKKNPRSGTR